MMKATFNIEIQERVATPLFLALFFFFLFNSCTAQFSSSNSIGMYAAASISDEGYGIRLERQFDYRESWVVRAQTLGLSKSTWTSHSLAFGYSSLYPLKSGVFRLGIFVDTGLRSSREAQNEDQQAWFSTPFLEVSYAYQIGDSQAYLFTCANVGKEWKWSGAPATNISKWPQQLTVGVYWNWCKHQLAKTM